MSKKEIFWLAVGLVVASAGYYFFIRKKGTTALPNGTSMKAKNAMNVYDETFGNIIRSKATGEWVGTTYGSAQYNGDLWYRAYDSNKGKISFKASDVEPA